MTNPAKQLGARAALEAVDAELPSDTFDVIFDAAAIRDIGTWQAQADLTEVEIAELDQQIQQVTLGASENDARYGEEPPGDALREQRQAKQAVLEDLIRRMDERRRNVKKVSVTLQAMPFAKWETLNRAHPPILRDAALTGGEGKPRQYIAEDALGVHAETFFPIAVRECLIVPSVKADDDWEYFTGKVHDGEWGRICIRAWNLNGRSLDVPKSLTTSGVTPMPGVG